MSAYECFCGRRKRRDARVCDGHLWNWLCPACERIKPLNAELCRDCTSENAKDVERTTAQPYLRLLPGGKQ